MQRHQVANNAVLCELHKELESVLETHARQAPRALRCALKLALRETFDALQAQGAEPELLPEPVLEAFIEEMIFEIALHIDTINASALTHELSARVTARLSPPAVAA